MSGLIRVGVSGLAGRMGSHVVDAVSAAPDMEFVGGADPARDDDVQGEVVLTRELDDFLSRVQPDVVVDFSVPAAVVENARKILAAGSHCVIGTTGISAEEREELGKAAEQNGVGVLVAPNFAVGAVLMMQFAAQAAKFFEGVEIVELHHEKKLDSPSGTALMTAEKIAQQWEGTPGPDDGLARGQVSGGVHVHSVRLPGLVAHQEVLFGNPGEAFTIRHDSFDRKSFMGGVLLGVRKIREHKGLVFGLEHFLFQ